MRTLSKWYQLLALLTVAFVLSACGGGGSSDTATTFTVEGRVLNGVLVGSSVEVFGSNGQRLATATTDADGRYSAEVSQAGPYRLRATGGKLNGVDYTGILEAACDGGSSCFVTPYTTVLLRLVDDHGFNMGDGAALLANSLGFDGDPFAEDVPTADFDLDAARQAIAGGNGLDVWVESMAEWVTDEAASAPPGVVTSDPADPVSYTVSTTAGPGGSLEPANRTVGAGETATFTVIPDTGYSIEQVTGCGGSLAGDVYIVGAVTASCTVSATFALNEYTLTYAAGPNGSLSGETSQTVTHGGSGTAVTAIPNIGYVFVQWSDASTANPRTDTNVTSDLSITANFAPVTINENVSLRVEARPIADPINVFVTVTNGGGAPVGGLTSADFTVLVDGVEVVSPTYSLSPIQDAEQQVSVVFVMDYSGSTIDAQPTMEQSVLTFLDVMELGDYAAIIKFSETNSERVAVLQPFTMIDRASGSSALAGAVTTPYSGDGSPVIDAVATAVQQFVSPPMPLPAGPKVVILISAGGDNISESTGSTAAGAAIEQGISIFALGVGNVGEVIPDRDITGRQLLQEFAFQTGGQYYEAPDDQAIQDAHSAISTLLQNEYLLTFESNITDCEVHTVEVRVTGQNPATSTFTRCNPPNTSTPPPEGDVGGTLVP